MSCWVIGGQPFKEEEDDFPVGELAVASAGLNCCCRAAWPMQVPERYIIVERMDAVEIHFIFIYSDDAQTEAAAGMQSSRLQLPAPGSATAAVAQPRRRTSPLLYVLLAYIGWMLWVVLWDNWPCLRRVLRRQLGVRF